MTYRKHGGPKPGAGQSVERIRSVPCPVCEAGSGEPCHVVNHYDGTPRHHHDRVQRAAWFGKEERS